MRICFLSLDYLSDKGGGGVGALIQVLARSLVKQGHRVTVVALMTDGESIQSNDAGVKVIRFHQGDLHRYPIRMPLVWRLSRPIRELERSWNSWKVIKELHSREPFDLIETTESGGLFMALMMPCIPMVARLHGEPYTFYKYTPGAPSTRDIKLVRFLQRIALRRAKMLIAPSKAHSLEIINELGKRHPPVRVIHNAVQLPARGLLSSLELDTPSANEKSAVVLYVGRLERAKGVPLLLAAARQVLDVMPETRFVLAGGETHTLPRKELESLMVRYELNGKVKLLGHVSRSQLSALYQQATVCVLPSYYETFGLAALEAMTMCRAVVATRAGGLPELIQHESTGLLVPPGDHRALAEAIIRLIDDPSLRERVAQAGQLHAAESFRVDRMVDMTLEVYQILRGKSQYSGNIFQQ